MTVAPPTREGGKTANPYVGPRPFAQADVYRFFGRDREAAELYSLVAAHRTVLLYAQSGAGKTSLLNAGLIPRLEQGGFDVLPPARVSRPNGGRAPDDRVKNVYVLNLALAWTPPNTINDEESLPDLALAGVLENYPRSESAHGSFLPRVLVFDQFEELFTAYPQRWRDRRGFFEQLDDAMSADPSLRVLFAMREDFIAHIDPYEDLLPEEFRTRYRLEQLREDAALAAVERPLEETGIRFRAGIAERLVADLLKAPSSSVDNSASEEIALASEGLIAGEFVEPVQLQVVCFSLFRNLPEGTTEITPEHLATFGNVDQALQEFYQSALKEAAGKASIKEDSLRQWFESELITEAGSRGLVFRGETATGGIPNPAVDALEELHIIRAEVRGRDRWYELTHDRFIRPIQRSNQEWKSGQWTTAVRKVVTETDVPQDVLMQLLPLLLPKNERIHLVNLAQGRTTPYRGNHPLRGELRRLRSLGLIRMRPGQQVGYMKDGLSYDLATFVELTDLGKRWARTIQEMEKAEAGSAA